MRSTFGRWLRLAAWLAVALLSSASQAAQTTETLTFIHTDVAGSVIGQSNAAGNVSWRENYRPYGERTVNSSGAAGNRQFFHGKAFDPDSELLYLGARYYDPVVGRFMGVDAAGFDESNLHSFNRYAYGNNNPLKFADPDGRAGQSIVPILIGVGLWLGFESLLPMPTVAPGSGQVLSTSFPDLGVGTVALGIAKALGKGAATRGIARSAEELSQAAATLDREGLTVAGRALQKHGSRQGSAFPEATGNPQSINQQAQKMVDDILTSPSSTAVTRHHARFGEVTEIRAPDGRGIRYGADGKFIGLLEPNK
jgi:RHS repeat-associated protein